MWYTSYGNKEYLHNEDATETLKALLCPFKSSECEDLYQSIAGPSQSLNKVRKTVLEFLPFEKRFYFNVL